MSETSPRQFLELLKKSELVEPAVLKKSLADLASQAGGKPVRLNEIGDHLEANGLITAWQREKLEGGKFKGFFLGQYRLLGLLGAGGMSTVYLAEHKLSNHRRAIKILPKQLVADKSYLDRFYREGRAAAALSDPNIVRIYDLANEEDVHYMVMEYVEGIDLQELVLRDGPLPVERALKYLRQAATGLKHAHDRNIVHRDVKPSNLLANSKDEIKVLDLGLVLMHESDESLTLLHNDRVMGTADYLSPEQAIDSHEVDSRADIYSLGCTLYFLLTGRPPFPKGSIAQRIALHQTKEAPLVSEINSAIPDAVAQLCFIMMRKSREDRIQGCRELITEINNIQNAMEGADAMAGQTHLALAGLMEPEKIVSYNASATDIQRTSSEPFRPVTAGRVPNANPSTAPGVPANGHAKAGPAKESRQPAPVLARSKPATPAVKPVAVGNGRPVKNVSSGSAQVKRDSSRSRVDPKFAGIVLPDENANAADPLVTGISAGPRLVGKRTRANRKTVLVIGGIIVLMFGTLLAVLVVAVRFVQ